MADARNASRSHARRRTVLVTASLVLSGSLVLGTSTPTFAQAAPSTTTTVPALTATTSPTIEAPVYTPPVFHTPVFTPPVFLPNEPDASDPDASSPPSGPAGPPPIKGLDKPASTGGRSSRLTRLLEDARARRARLSVEITHAEAAIAELQARKHQAQVVVDRAVAVQRDVQTQLAQVNRNLGLARDGVRAAEVRLQSVSKAGHAPPVAHPPARGHGPKEQLAHARREVSESLVRSADMADLAERKLAESRRAEDDAESARREMEALAEQVQAGHDGVAALRQELASVGDNLGASTSLVNALGSAGGEAKPSARAIADIPPEMLELYRRAASTCPGLSWTVLAAVGSVESSHGRADLAGVRSGSNSAGAMGPMQFLGATWASYGVDGDGDGKSDVYSAADAVFGAAKYLCASGAGRVTALAAAIWAYNHADWYVQAVLEVAAGYGSVGLVETQKAAAALVEEPNLTLSPQARDDILSGVVDNRVIMLLAAASAKHSIAVSVIRSGHSKFVSGTDRVSNHYQGRGVDIYAVDGAAVSSSNEAALRLAMAVLASAPPLRPDELGSPWTSLNNFAGAFSDEGHANHIHLGWR